MRQHVLALTLFLVGAWGFQSQCGLPRCLPSTQTPLRLSPTYHQIGQMEPKPRHWMSSEETEETESEDAEEIGIDNEDEIENNTKMIENDELVEGRKILTMVGYRFASLVYMFLGLFIAGWQGLKSPAQLPLACYVSAGPMLAAGVSYVLEGAAVNDRLSSETFKRLNLFLAQYGALWLFAAYLIRNTGSRIVTNPLVIAASGITVFNSLRAWTFGVKGWQKSQAASSMSDLISTIRKYLKVIFTINTFTGSVYLCGAFLFTGLKIARLVDVFQLLLSGGVGVTVFSKDIFRIALYSLLSAVMVTLKDGGDRDRLTGSSYVELNTISTFVLAAMGAYFYNLGSIALGAGSAFLAFFTGTMSYVTFKEKREALL